jgi:hypothetical protein
MMPAFFTAESIALRIAMSIAALLTLFIFYRRAGWIRGPFSVDCAVWDADGRWFLSRADKTWEATLRGSSWLNGRAMVLQWDAVDGNEPRTSMLLAEIDLGAIAFRRLGIRLRIDGLRATPATDSLLA